jgi:hypothetical protein
MTGNLNIASREDAFGDIELCHKGAKLVFKPGKYPL